MRHVLYLSVAALVLGACGTTYTTPPAPLEIPTAASTLLPTKPPETPFPIASIPPMTSGAANATEFPDPKNYHWAQVVTGLASPVDIQFPDDGSGRLFVVEQAGRIVVAKDGQLSQTPFLDIRGKVGSRGNEQGLLGLAFHPAFKDNPYFYMNYTDAQGDTVIARLQATGDAADPASQKDLIHLDQPFPNHNGGVLAFGPDGFLYAGLGDGGSAGDPYGNGQNQSVLLGKILRIDVDHGDPYSVPPSNPFGNEIWDYGLRNPWRFSFDKPSGDLFIGDVGQDAWEEVDYVPAGHGGLDFGWNYREGSHIYRGSPPATLKLTYPVDEYSHAGGRCSVTGGYVYRGGMAEWQGIYLYGDYCSGQVWGMLRTTDPSSKTGWVSQVLYETGSNITSFGQDASGEIYFADRGGTICELQREQTPQYEQH
jgi:glucose/arabinose dehydrogenase